MNRKLIIAALASLAGALALPDTGHAAEADTPKVDARQAKQEARIDAGLAQGQLTQREAKRLKAEQNVIDRAENRAKADGHVTRHERKRLHAMQNGASRDIQRQRHDRQAPSPKTPG